MFVATQMTVIAKLRETQGKYTAFCTVLEDGDGWNAEIVYHDSHGVTARDTFHCDSLDDAHRDVLRALIKWDANTDRQPDGTRVPLLDGEQLNLNPVQGDLSFVLPEPYSRVARYRPPGTVTVQEAARRTGIAESYYHKYLAYGKMPGHKVNGRWYIPEEVINDILKARPQ